MPNNQPVGVMSIVLELNSATYSEAISEATRKLDAMAGKARTAGTSTVSSMRAASAVIRELNGDFTNNIRAVEAFLSNTLGLGGALQKLFPLAGALAFVGVLGEGGEKLVQWRKESQESTRTLELGLRSILQGQMLTNDHMRQANDLIDDQIAKLEHKPKNALRDALDDARAKADELADSLSRDAEKFEEVMKKGSSGFWGQLFGKGQTTGVENAAKLYFGDVQDLSYKRQIALGQGDAKQADDLQHAMDARTDAEIRRLQGEIALRSLPSLAERPAGYKGPLREPRGDLAFDQTKNLTGLRDELALIYLQRDNATLGSANAKGTGTLRGLQTGAEQTEEAKAAAEKRFKEMQDELEQQKSTHAVSLGDEADFWSAKLAIAKGNADLYAKVQKQVNTAQKSLADELRRGWEEDARVNQQITDGVEEGYRKLLKDEADAAKAQYATASSILAGAGDQRLAALTGANRARDFEVRLSPEGEAARVSAAGHVAEYAARSRDLAAQMTRASGAPGATPEDIEARQRSIATIQREVDELDRQHDLQMAEDAARIESTTLLGGASDALREFARAATDGGAIVKNLLGTGLNATNDAIVRTLTTPGSQRRGQHVFGQVGHQLAADTAGAALKYGEGKLIGGLFGRKADGSTEASALWVRISGGARDAASGALSGVMGKMGGLGGFLGKALPFVSGMIPGFATGVQDFGGGLAMVGERGPELLQLPPHSNVIPNGDFGGGGDTHIENHLHFHGDNWNENDVDKRIGRALKQATPHIGAATIRALDERKARSVLGRY